MEPTSPQQLSPMEMAFAYGFMYGAPLPMAQPILKRGDDIQAKMKLLDDSLTYIALLERQVVRLNARMKRNEERVAVLLDRVNKKKK